MEAATISAVSLPSEIKPSTSTLILINLTALGLGAAIGLMPVSKADPVTAAWHTAIVTCQALRAGVPFSRAIDLGVDGVRSLWGSSTRDPDFGRLAANATAELCGRELVRAYQASKGQAL